MPGSSGLAYSDLYLRYDFGVHHPLRPIRIKLTVDLISAIANQSGKSFTVLEPGEASKDEILLFHDLEYVNRIEEASKRGRGLLDAGDTPAFQGCFEASAKIVGGSLELARKIINGELDHGFNPGGGLHHAHRDSASGFCIFNDPAVTVSLLKNEGLKRIVYLDIDAHHGDGVMYGFYGDKTLLDIDFHENGRFLFPGTGFPDETGQGEASGLKINMPFPPGTCDRQYLDAFDGIVPKLIRRFRPGFILLQAGADSHGGDPLTHMNLTTHSYQHIVREVHKLSHDLCEGRMLLFGGGGYNLANVARCWTVAFAEISGIGLPESLPEEWRRVIEKAGVTPAPSRVHDPEPSTSQDDRISRDVNSSIGDLRGLIPMLREE